MKPRTFMMNMNTQVVLAGLFPFNYGKCIVKTILNESTISGKV